jgi:hypothetical protein
MDHPEMNPIFSIFLLAAALLWSSPGHAAITLTPTVAGLAAGVYQPAAAGAVSSGVFSVQGAATISGRVVTLPGTLPVASNAASYAADWLFANPLVATAALLLWPSSLGLEPDVSGWTLGGQAAPQTVPFEEGTMTVYCRAVYGSSCAASGSSTNQGACDRAGAYQFDAQLLKCRFTAAQCSAIGFTGCYDGVWIPTGSITETNVHSCPAGYWPGGSSCVLNDTGLAASGSRAATRSDFDGLSVVPDSALHDLAELAGVPVQAPAYEPADVPIGDPYTRPDGSTAQPRAKITPAANGQVSVDTYDKPLTDAQGNPTPDAQPQDTTESTPSQCEQFPNSLGCANLDQVTPDPLSTESRSISMISPESIGGAGACPADMSTAFLGHTVTFSFAPLCTYANALRPLVLALAWLSAGILFIGGVKNG